MDTTLLTLTVLSMAIAIATSLVAWRGRREEAARAVLRVATLRSAAGLDGAPVFMARRQWPVLGVVAALVAGTAIVAASMVAVSGRRTAATTATPLELVALQHDSQGGRLSVSGRVRNPVAGQPMADVAAVVHVFDAQGAQVSSGATPLAEHLLASGHESAFEVTFHTAQPVARYRVAFTTTGTPTAHIDRRSSSTLASRNAEPAARPR